MGKQGAQGKESLFTGARRQDDATSMVLSTAVTSPQTEENCVKKNDATLSGHGLETDRPARTTFQLPGRHSSVWGTKF